MNKVHRVSGAIPTSLPLSSKSRSLSLFSPFWLSEPPGSRRRRRSPASEACPGPPRGGPHHPSESRSVA
eukprot:171878-Hanusia_phi.AAC.1